MLFLFGMRPAALLLAGSLACATNRPASNASAWQASLRDQVGPDWAKTLKSAAEAHRAKDCIPERELRTVVAFRVNRDGLVFLARLDSSSGDSRVDGVALDAIKRIGRLSLPPPADLFGALSSKEFSFAFRLLAPTEEECAALKAASAPLAHPP